MTVEVWQARPDGTYSSLRDGREDGDCRSTQRVWSTAEFETVVPGSTGIFGGIGPNRWDFPPYGPPVIHLLVSSPSVAARGTADDDDDDIDDDGPSYRPVLVDIPMQFDRRTLERRSSFRWPDMRGIAWARQGNSNNNNDGDPLGQGYTIQSWDVNAEKNTINVEVDVYLERDGDQRQQQQQEQLLCPSSSMSKILFPASFFLEPIAVCTPSMLDFFAM